MDQRTRRSPARFLAPLALVAIVIAFLMIVNGSGRNGGGSNAASGTTTTTSKSKGSARTKTTSSKKPGTQAGGRRYYVVQVGDTLGGIAGKTGVPLTRIEALNPAVDPHAMTAGQKIKLR
jgi:LysM repeat protein